MLNKDSTTNSPAGTWSMVYDEGFEIKSDNTRYFAFNKYEKSHGDF